MRVDCLRACILGHVRANQGRAASYKPTNHNLQSMTVKKPWKSLEHKVSYTHARRFRARCHARKVTARNIRVDCWRACSLRHLRANHGRAASYKPTNHNLQSMTVKKLWNTKYLTLMRADSGRAVMRARSRRAYARRLPARMHSWPPARKSWARCKLQTHQPQLTEYDCDESLEHKVSDTHARRFRTRCHARKVTARICA